MKKYRKQAKIAMAVTLATTSLGNTIPALSAQEGQIQENNIDKKDETSEVENLPEIEETPEIEKFPMIEDEEVEEVIEINNITEEISSLENNQIENKEENNSIEKTDVEVIMNEDFFPDPGFREVLKKQLDVEEGDVLSYSDIHNVFFLFLQGTEDNPRSDIKSLEGIQYFYNLGFLDCAYQTELAGTLDLTSNKNIAFLQLYDTKVDGLKIDGLNYINVFNIGKTNIGGTFDLSNCKNLEILNVSNTNVSGINIDGLTKLKDFYIYNTNIGGEFDLSANTNLEYIYAQGTKVTGINVDGLTNLIVFNASNNPQLEGEFDLSRNVELKYIYANDAKVTGINIDGLTNLIIFNASNNPQLEGEFDFTGNSQMKLININNTKVSSINAKGLSNLTQLGIGSSLVGGVIDLRGCDSLRGFYAAYSQIEQINTEGLSNLELFYVFNIPSLTGTIDLSGNKSLKHVQAHQTSINQINLEGAESLMALDLYYTNISQINLEGLDNLLYLALNNTPLNQINLENLVKLQMLYISDTNISGTLDLRPNTELQEVVLYGTNVDQINVEGLTNLNILSCYSTSISSLDVSTNTNLSRLFTIDNNLTWLNIGDNANLTKVSKGDSVIDLGQLEDSFNIATVTEAFKGIDISKVTVVSGATYDPTTGEVSGYRNGTPIVYHYDCGTMENGEAVTLTVTLNFTKPLVASEIHINHYDGKVYDGVAVSDPTDITKTAESSGDVTFEWFSKTEDGNWEPLEQAPVNAGNYGVKAHLAADLHYAAADSGEPTPFEITKAVSTVSINSYEGKVYDGTAVSNPTDITATGSNGAVTFEWFVKTEDGVWESLGEQAPINAGEYGVKAHLAANQNYAEANSGEPTSFEITKVASTVSINSYEGKVYDGNPVGNPTDITTTGSNGAVTFEWFIKTEDGNWEPLEQAPVNVGNYGVKAHLAANQNYTAADSGEPIPFEITKATSTISIDSYDGKVYDGTAVGNPTDITTTGSNGAITFEWFVKTEDGQWEPLEEAPINVGNYGVKAHLAADQNYTAADSGEPTPFEVTKAASTIIINNYIGKVYDGTAVSNPTDITTAGSDGTVTFEWFRKTADGAWESLGEQAPVNAGEYGVKAHLAANQNYTAADSGEPTPFEITKATSTIIINNYPSKVYDGTVVSNPTDIATTGSDGTIIFEWFRKTTDGAWESLGEQAPVNVGDYGVKAHLAANQNYAEANSGEPTSFTITQAPSSININSYDGKVYDGTSVSNPTDITRTDNNAVVTFKYYRADDTTTEIPAPSEVGAYKVKAFLSGDTNYVDSESNFVDFNIAALGTTITLTYGDQVYTGNPVQEPQKDVHYTVQGSTGTVIIEWYEASDLTTPLAEAPINVGSYVVKVSVEGTDTHTGASKTTSFEITPASSTIRINNYAGKVYDGAAVSNPVDITTTGSDGAVTFEWFVKTEDGNWEPLEQAPVNVGEYGVKAHLAANQNYTAANSGEPTPFEITKATSSIRINSYDGKVYDGNPVSDPTDITRTQNTATVTFKYYRADGMTEIAAPSEVGNYKVKAFLSGDTNYVDSESNFVDFNIAALGTTITFTYGNQVYTGNPVQEPQYTVEGSTGAVTIEWYEANNLTTPLAEAPTNVGSYVVKVSVAGTDTHIGASKTASFEITPAPSTIRINDYAGKVYDGIAVSNPTDVVITGSDGAVTFEWFTKDESEEWVSLGNQAPVNAGSYGVKSYLAANQNYAAADSGEPIPFEITKSTSTISIDNYEGKVYDGTVVSNPTEVTTTGSDGAVTFEWFTKDENGQWVSLGDQAPVDTGNYGVKAHLAANQNYAAADSGEPTAFEITKSTSTISINNYAGKVYDGVAVSNPTDITTIGSSGAITFEWFTKDENGQWISLGEEAPIDAGNYGVKAYLAANQNYEAADSGEPTPFEITKSTSTVEILDDLNKTYDGEAVKEPTIKVEGTSEIATISWFKKESDGVTRAVTWTPLTSAPVNAGDYKVVVVVAENSNSLGATAEQEFTIAKADTNVSIEGILDKEYDGVEVVPTIKVEGSSGATTVEWYQKDANGAWELLPNAPKEVGEYKVVVKVEEDENYLSKEVEQTFTISEKVEVPSIPEEGGDNTTTEEEKVEGVQTGDVSQTSMWTMLVGLSMSMMYFFRRKKTK